MLVKIILSNFKSFKVWTEIDFTKTDYKILEDTNVYEDKILKGAIFVGGNATGKTNIILSLKLLFDLLFSNHNIDLKDYICFFSNKTFSCLSYEFNIENNKIVYSFSFIARNNKISSEKLVLNNKIILERTMEKAKSEITEIKEFDDLDSETLFLRTIYFNTRFNNNEILKKWFEFLSNSVYLNPHQKKDDKQVKIKKYLENNGVDKFNKFFEENNFNQKIEFGNESFGKTIVLSSMEKEIFFKRDKIEEPIPYYLESLGNQNLISLLPSFFKVIENGGMLVIDEFSSAFHNELERLLIKYFMKNSKNSQIFLVSHSTNLLSNSIFRPDQAYSVDFFENGSVVNRFSDEKPRESQNIEKMYNSGCFGGVPNYKPEYME